MANSSLEDTVNAILRLCGEEEITDPGVFAGTSVPTRMQSQCIAFVDLADRMLLLHMNERFMQRHFTLNLVDESANVNQSPPSPYALDASINVESVLWHSFICSTSGKAYKMRMWDYREFREYFPDPTIIPASVPRLWIPLPPEITDNPASDNVCFFPRPNGQYTIEYQAKINRQPLKNATDSILWTPEYEHVLWLQGKLFLEQALGEGKESDIAMYVQKALDELKSWASAPIEARSAVRPGLYIEGVRRGRTRRPWMYPISK